MWIIGWAAVSRAAAGQEPIPVGVLSTRTTPVRWQDPLDVDRSVAVQDVEEPATAPTDVEGAHCMLFEPGPLRLHTTATEGGFSIRCEGTDLLSLDVLASDGAREYVLARHQLQCGVSLPLRGWQDLGQVLAPGAYNLSASVSGGSTDAKVLLGALIVAEFTQVYAATAQGVPAAGFAVLPTVDPLYGRAYTVSPSVLREVTQ